jgi:hypothetical protein
MKKEIVLPDGRFVEIDDIKLIDVAAALSLENNILAVCVLLERVAKIDGKRYTFKEWTQMSLEEIYPAFDLVASSLTRALNSKSVA